jgi:hypothetical protein
LIAKKGERAYALTAKGYEWLASLGLDTGNPVFEQEDHARQCLDWTERQHHIAGPLGACLMEAYVAWNWMERQTGSRSISITKSGWAALLEHFGIEQGS